MCVLRLATSFVPSQSAFAPGTATLERLIADQFVVSLRANLPPHVFSALGLGQTQKSGGIVIEDVALLHRG